MMAEICSLYKAGRLTLRGATATQIEEYLERLSASCAESQRLDMLWSEITQSLANREEESMNTTGGTPAG